MSKIFAVRVHVQYYISCEQFIICQIRNFLAVCLWISRQTRFFRRIPHFPRSWGARAPGMWPFLDKSFSVGKGNSILLRSQLTVAINNLYLHTSAPYYAWYLRTFVLSKVLSKVRKYIRRYFNMNMYVTCSIEYVHTVCSYLPSKVFYIFESTMLQCTCSYILHIGGVHRLYVHTT